MTLPWILLNQLWTNMVRSSVVFADWEITSWRYTSTQRSLQLHNHSVVFHFMFANMWRKSSRRYNISILLKMPNATRFTFSGCSKVQWQCASLCCYVLHERSCYQRVTSDTNPRENTGGTQCRCCVFHTWFAIGGITNLNYTQNWVPTTFSMHKGLKR